MSGYTNSVSASPKKCLDTQSLLLQVLLQELGGCGVFQSRMVGSLTMKPKDGFTLDIFLCCADIEIDIDIAEMLCDVLKLLLVVKKLVLLY